MRDNNQSGESNLLDEIILKAAHLSPVPEESVKAYKEKLYTLLEQVNEIMEARQDIEHLRGDNSRRVMLNNHKNHALFMANIFRFSCFAMLATIVPWVYRTYSKRGFAFEYFPAHIKAWQKSVGDMLDANAAAPILNVYDWMLKQHDDFITLSQNTEFITATPPPGWEKTCDSLLEALLEGDRQRSLEISFKHSSDADDVMSFYNSALRPAMYKIGELWEKGIISVADEHLATAIVNRVVSMQYMHFNPPRDIERGMAIVTSAQNEFHEMGARLVANALEMDGWNVNYLGADTPGEEIIRITEKTQPDLLAVSVTMPFNLETVFELTNSLKKNRSTINTRVMLGGLALNNSRELVETFESDGYALNCRESVELARRWWEGDGHNESP